ncbi:MAG: acyltransferase family protein [Clostridiales bacterium]|nr:acyltransferase family protein [Clostridiales bacterium]
METLKETDIKVTREKLPDVLKGFGIILVVLGHCIQVGNGAEFNAESLYFSDKLYQFIYSFHMPLFMMVSGYLCWGSMKRALDGRQRLSLLKRRILALPVPIFVWTALEFLIKTVINLFNGNVLSWRIIFDYLYSVFNNFWFLWAVFWCFLIVFIMHFYFHDSIILYILGFLALFFIPDGMALGAYKYMLPYFIAPFYLHKYMEQKKVSLDKAPKIKWLALTGLVYIILFLFFDENSFIYLSGYKLIGKDMISVIRQLRIDFYRMVIGFVGSAFFILLWQYIIAKLKNRYEFKIMSALGKDSMGIYILSTYILSYVVQNIYRTSQPNYLLNLAQAAAVLAVSLLLTELIGLIPIVRKLVGK